MCKFSIVVILGLVSALSAAGAAADSRSPDYRYRQQLERERQQQEYQRAREARERAEEFAREQQRMRERQAERQREELRRQEEVVRSRELARQQEEYRRQQEQQRREAYARQQQQPLVTPRPPPSGSGDGFRPQLGGSPGHLNQYEAQGAAANLHNRAGLPHMADQGRRNQQDLGSLGNDNYQYQPPVHQPLQASPSNPYGTTQTNSHGNPYAGTWWQKRAD